MARRLCLKSTKAALRAENLGWLSFSSTTHSESNVNRQTIDNSKNINSDNDLQTSDSSSGSSSSSHSMYSPGITLPSSPLPASTVPRKRRMIDRQSDPTNDLNFVHILEITRLEKALNEANKTYQNKLGVKQIMIQNLQQQNIELKQILKDNGLQYNHQHRLIAAEKAAENLRAENEKQSAHNTDLQKQVDGLETINKTIKEDNRQLTENVEHQKVELEKYAKALEEKTNDYDNLRENYEHLKEQLRKWRQDKEAIEDAVGTMLGRLKEQPFPRFK